MQLPWCLADALSFLTSDHSRAEDRPKSGAGGGGVACVPVCAYSRCTKYTPPPSGCRFFFLSMNVVGNCGYAAIRGGPSISDTKQSDVPLDDCYLTWLRMEIFLSSFMIRQNLSQFMISEGLECVGNFQQSCLIYMQ